MPEKQPSGTEKKEGEKKEEEKKELLQVDVDLTKFDLEAFVAPYTGHSRIARLLFVADHCKGLRSKAFKLALADLKQTSNTQLYKSITEKAFEEFGSEFTLDTNYIQAMDKKSAQTQEKLETELTEFKKNLIKPSIKKAQNELGDFHYERGDLNSALRCYVRTRDYCSSADDILQMCLNVIKVSIELGNYSHVSNYISKAEQTPNLTDKTVIARLKVCTALSYLANKKYKISGRQFLEVSNSVGNYSTVMSNQDIAIFAGLCALATFDRSDLKNKVIDNVGFKPFLELSVEMREAINDFYNSKYSSCLASLEKMKSHLMLDMHLHEHVVYLFEKIRQRALVQYFHPFSSVDMKTMANAFGTTVENLEKEISVLIVENAISARIDSQNKVLIARTTDQRSSTFEKTISLTGEFQDQTESMLLRMNMLRNDVLVKPSKGSGGSSSSEVKDKHKN